MGGQHEAPAALCPKRPGTCCTEGWAGLGDDTKDVVRIRFCPRAVQPLASRYTNCAILGVCVPHSVGNCAVSDDGLQDNHRRNGSLLQNFRELICT
jgi:hypothetical protein